MVKLFLIITLAFAGCSFPEQNANVLGGLGDGDGIVGAEHPDKLLYKVSYEGEALQCLCSIHSENCGFYEEKWGYDPKPLYPDAEDTEVEYEKKSEDPAKKSEDPADAKCERTPYSVKLENTLDKKGLKAESYYIIEDARLTCECYAATGYTNKVLEASGDGN